MAKEEEERTQKFSGVRSSNSNNSGIVIASMNTSSSSSLSSYSKKQKQKKVPQRGLGVAQLEKIRKLEEQQEENKKHHGVVVSPSSSSSTSSATKVISSSSQSSQSKPHFPSLPCLPSLLHNNVDAIWQQQQKPVSGLAGHHFSIPKSHSFGDFCNGNESFAALDHGFAYGTNNPIWHPHRLGLVQSPQQYQQLLCPPLVSVSSSSTSSVMKVQMEPPSNQSFCSNFTPMRALEEEKIVRLKRPYPFSLDNPPGPTINYKVPTLFHHSSMSNELTSVGNGCTMSLDPSNHLLRENPLPPSMSNLKSKQCLMDNGTTNADFLRLAPPATNILLPNTCIKNAPHLQLYKDDLPDVEPPLYQGTKEYLYLQSAPSGSSRQQPYYCFLSTPQGKSGEKPTTMNNSNGCEEGGNLDLDLKL